MAKPKPKTVAIEVPIIPQIVVKRVWPHFQDDEVTESIESVESAIIVQWERTADCDDISNPQFFGPTAQFIRGAHDLKTNAHGDARIAIANYGHLIANWAALLAKKCLSRANTNPPVKV